MKLCGLHSAWYDAVDKRLCRVIYQRAVTLRHIPVYHHNLFIQHWVGGAEIRFLCSLEEILHFSSQARAEHMMKNPVINSKIDPAP